MIIGIAMGVAFMAWALSSKDKEEEREEELD
jgi:hypothetical protein